MTGKAAREQTKISAMNAQNAQDLAEIAAERKRIEEQYVKQKQGEIMLIWRGFCTEIHHSILS